MGVVMKGGTSGCRQDYLAPVPDSGDPQPVEDTSGRASNPNVHFQAEHYRNVDPEDSATPTFMPTSGTNPVEGDPRAQGADAQNLGGLKNATNGVFKGTPEAGPF